MYNLNQNILAVWQMYSSILIQMVLFEKQMEMLKMAIGLHN